jgi:hypothetical protein
VGILLWLNVRAEGVALRLLVFVRGSVVTNGKGKGPRQEGVGLVVVGLLVVGLRLRVRAVFLEM